MTNEVLVLAGRAGRTAVPVNVIGILQKIVVRRIAVEALVRVADVSIGLVWAVVYGSFMVYKRFFLHT